MIDIQIKSIWLLVLEHRFLPWRHNISDRPKRPQYHQTVTLDCSENKQIAITSECNRSKFKMGGLLVLKLPELPFWTFLRYPTLPFLNLWKLQFWSFLSFRRYTVSRTRKLLVGAHVMRTPVFSQHKSIPQHSWFNLRSGSFKSATSWVGLQDLHTAGFWKVHAKAALRIVSDTWRMKKVELTYGCRFTCYLLLKKSSWKQTERAWKRLFDT